MASRTSGRPPRERLNPSRVVREAVALADEQGLDAVTMRSLAQRLGVEAMALYNHVDNKDRLLDGIVEFIVDEINQEVSGADNEPREAIRARILTARQVLLRHRWAPKLLESRAGTSPAVVRYYDSLVGLFLQDGFSPDLVHHAMHALGSRALGYTQEPWDDTQAIPDPARLAEEMRADYPHIAAMLSHVSHDRASTLGWCDDQTEFEFALDILLEGLHSRRDAATPRRR
jgi:AcrR family transcriptional regulator